MAPRFRSLVAAMLIAILALGAGCSNSAGPDEDEDAGYVVRSSPKRAVRKLVETYEAMDEVEYADCFGADFEFWLNPGDLGDPHNPLPTYWGLTEELAIATNMLGDGTSVSSIQLTLTQLGDGVEIPAPNPGDPSTWVYTYSVDLYVHVPNDFTYWANAASRFTMAVDPDETGPGGETLWEIVKWEDIDMPTLGGDRTEESTWTSIKAMFRTAATGRSESASWSSIKALYR